MLQSVGTFAKSDFCSKFLLVHLEQHHVSGFCSKPPAKLANDSVQQQLLVSFFGNVRLMQPSTKHPLHDQMICVQKHTDKIRQILCFQHMVTNLS